MIIDSICLNCGGITTRFSRCCPEQKLIKSQELVMEYKKYKALWEELKDFYFENVPWHKKPSIMLKDLKEKMKEMEKT
jgi:hypothetical protein